MRLENNKAIALRYLALLPLGRIGELPLAPEFAGWSSLSGEIPGSEFVARTRILPKMFVEPLKFTMELLTAEDNRVSLLCHSAGILITGTPYDNQYHILMTFADGLITKVYEYMNPLKAAVMFSVLQKIRGE